MIPFYIKKTLFYSYKKAAMKMFGCPFCQIAEHQQRSKVIFEDEQCLAFEDIRPQAPVHFLVIPRKHIISLNETSDADEALLGHLLAVAVRIAKEKGIDTSGYRTVINTNAEAGQTVFHLHIHVMGRRRMHWPPG